MRYLRLFLFLGLLAGLTLFSKAQLCACMDRQKVGQQAPGNWLPAPCAVRMLSLGFDRLLADLFWLGFVQYSGDQEVIFQGKFPLGYQYTNLITQIDPHFIKPYWFGCFTIGYWQKRPDLADQILQRGIAENPTNWTLPFMAGVNQYLFAHNDRQAAAYYRQAARLPEAPDYLERHATILEADIPARVKEIRTWRSLYLSTSDPNVKASAREKLVQLWSRVYKEAPTEQIRRHAVQELQGLGVEVTAPPAPTTPAPTSSAPASSSISPPPAADVPERPSGSMQ